MSLKIRLTRAGAKKRPFYRIVIADSRYIAEDAAAAVVVHYDALPAVGDCRDAVEDGAPRAHAALGSNVLSTFQLAYGDVDAVKQLELSCASGEMLALLGPSGCGKSTTLKMAAGIEDVTAGEIYFGERPVTRLSPGDRNIAMVFEDYALYPQMTVWDNVAFPLKIRGLFGQPAAVVR